MGIEGLNNAGLGGLEAFQKLRAQAREKLATTPAQPAVQTANHRPTPTPGPSVGALNKALSPESMQIAFAAAKADILKTAASYQRTGETNKAQTAPRLGQYVDLVA